MFKNVLILRNFSGRLLRDCVARWNMGQRIITHIRNALRFSHSLLTPLNYVKQFGLDPLRKLSNLWLVVLAL